MHRISRLINQAVSIHKLLNASLFPRTYLKHQPGLQLCLNRFYSVPKWNKLPARPKWLVKEEDLEESFLKGGSGAGGQKINKTNSKVQLKHIPTNLVVTCQYSRSREQNRKRAREILAEKLDHLQNPETSRLTIVNKRRIETKRNKSKKTNRKYKLLENKDNDHEEEILLDIEDEVLSFEKR